MSASRRLLLLTTLFAVVLTAQPVVFEGGAVNVASFVPAQLPQYGIAQGSLFTVFGEDMGPEEIEFVQAFPVGTELAGSSIQVTVAGTTVDALMVFSQAGRLAAVLPSDTPLGDGTLTVTFNGETSDPIAIRVVEHNPGIFTLSQNGLGHAVLTDAEIVANTIVNSFEPGGVGVLWLTGLGARSEDAEPQLEDLQDALDLTILVGDQPVTEFLYAGPSPGNAGVDQINFFIPEDAPEGCAVSVIAQIGDAVSNFTQMAISSDGLVCDDDPLAFTRADIEKQQADGTLRVALAAFDTNLQNAAVIMGPPGVDSPGMHDGRSESVTALLFDAPFDVTNPVIGFSPGSCNVRDELFTNPPAPIPTQPLPAEVTPFVFATDPDEMMFTLPAGLFLADPNTPDSENEITFVSGQEWTADFGLADSDLMRTDEAQVSHTLLLDPEPFAAWDPSSAEADFMSVLRGDPILEDLTIPDLPTNADHIVAGTFIIQNAFWRTTVSCNMPGDQPLVFPQRVFNSINCGPQSPCNGTAFLNVLHSSSASVGTTVGMPNSIGKINGFDRVLIFFTFNLP